MLHNFVLHVVVYYTLVWYTCSADLGMWSFGGWGYLQVWSDCAISKSKNTLILLRSKGFGAMIKGHSWAQQRPCERTRFTPHET